MSVKGWGDKTMSRRICVSTDILAPLGNKETRLCYTRYSMHIDLEQEPWNRDNETDRDRLSRYYSNQLVENRRKQAPMSI